MVSHIYSQKSEYSSFTDFLSFGIQTAFGSAVSFDLLGATKLSLPTIIPLLMPVKRYAVECYVYGCRGSASCVPNDLAHVHTSMFFFLSAIQSLFFLLCLCNTKNSFFCSFTNGFAAGSNEPNKVTLLMFCCVLR